MLNQEYSFLVKKQFLQNLVHQDNISYIKIDLANRIVNSLRINLTPFKALDIKNYYKLYSDSDVMHKYCDGNIRSKQEVDKLLRNCTGKQEPSYFTITDKNTSSFIGTIFLTTRKQNAGEILLGFLINKDYWGKNYAKEALYGLLLCLLPLVRDNIRIVTATTRDDNFASQNILESFNFKYIENIEKFGQKRLLYALDIENIKELHKNITIHDEVDLI